MMNAPVFFRFTKWLLCLSLVFGLCGPIDFTPSAQAESPAAVKRLKKKLKKLKKRLRIALASSSSGTPTTPTAAKVPLIEMVMVPAGVLAENPSDAGNTSAPSTYGTVPYDFKIGKYEVSLDEYAAFLNAVGKSDAGEPNGLYHSFMASNQNIAGIMRSGALGSYVYSVIGSGKRPVTHVSWFDAARFCNWLHNGCPTGSQDASTTERGAYTLDGLAGGGLTISRNPGAKYWIPSEDEWYKAAYHQPQTLGGPVDHYWDYPTRRDVPNTPGNDIGPAENQANVKTSDGNYSVTESSSYDGNQNYLTDGGSYPESPSFYGTFDQGGNVYEWNDAVISGNFRGFRGGAWDSLDEADLLSSKRFSLTPGTDNNVDIGFRVASP